MTERIILIVVSVLMLVLTLSKKDKNTSMLTLGLTLGVALTLFENKIVLTIGFLIYILSSLMIGIYGIKAKKLKTLEKTVIILCGFWSFYANVSAILHLPYGLELRLSVIIPMILYFVLISKGIYRKKEFGFLTILNLDFLFRFLRIWN
ncbi:hypothetical protein E9993_16980 [Labilibacter sediminis]|nr:hypothetical protein E9993_16980 [Labilibacter sediminis]